VETNVGLEEGRRRSDIAVLDDEEAGNERCTDLLELDKYA
jgi:hypothetical protein